MDIKRTVERAEELVRLIPELGEDSTLVVAALDRLVATCTEQKDAVLAAKTAHAEAVFAPPPAAAE